MICVIFFQAEVDDNPSNIGLKHIFDQNKIINPMNTRYRKSVISLKY